MVRAKDERPYLPAMPQEARRHFPNLTALYKALKAEDVPPSPGFSNRAVPGEGPENARLVLVGEQPGDDEDLTERPFVGPAGRLLRACLKEAGIDEQRVFFTNAVKRFKFKPRGKRRLHQTPTAGDIKHYRWWLAEELRIVNPDVVVALGASALQALLGKREALGPLRGTLMPWHGKELLVTVHPSFLLRLPDEQAREIEQERFARELKLASTRLKTS
jgi:DNA polymerase